MGSVNSVSPIGNPWWAMRRKGEVVRVPSRTCRRAPGPDTDVDRAWSDCAKCVQRQALGCAGYGASTSPDGCLPSRRPALSPRRAGQPRATMPMAGLATRPIRPLTSWLEPYGCHGSKAQRRGCEKELEGHLTKTVFCNSESLSRMVGGSSDAELLFLESKLRLSVIERKIERHRSKA